MAATAKNRLGDGFLTLDPGLPGVKELGDQVTNVVFDPKPSTSDAQPVLSGNIVAGDYTEAPELSGTLLPDFGENVSVQEWLITNAGKTVAFEFVPNKLKARKITGHLQVTSVQIGGDVRKSDTIDFDFPVQDYAIAEYVSVG